MGHPQEGCNSRGSEGCKLSLVCQVSVLHMFIMPCYLLILYYLSFLLCYSFPHQVLLNYFERRTVHYCSISCTAPPIYYPVFLISLPCPIFIPLYLLCIIFISYCHLLFKECRLHEGRDCFLCFCFPNVQKHAGRLGSIE